MSGIMLVKQKVADVARWNAVFRDPELDAERRRHGLAVTGTYVDADDPDTIIVAMDMVDVRRARAFARSTALADARARAGAIGSPDGVWYGPEEVK
ncbi:MAG TPA: hypothetical protein VF069_29500 [Streptosporangiaceae bacterium]